MQRIYRQRFELPILVTQEIIDRSPFTTREPNTFGAAFNWGQVEDRGSTMLISAEITPAELGKIPEIYRRGSAEDITIEVERRRRREEQRKERSLIRGQL